MKFKLGMNYSKAHLARSNENTTTSTGNDGIAEDAMGILEFRRIPSIPTHEDKLEIKRTYLTKALAERLMETNKENIRPRDPKRADRYKREFLSGRWDDNGETLKLGVNGVLLDSQHRLKGFLAACEEKSWLNVPVTLVWGVESALNIDTGKPRGLNVYLKALGYKDATNLAACVNWIWVIRHMGVKAKTSNAYPTHSEAVELLRKEPEITKYLAYGKRIRTRGNGMLLSAAKFGALLYLFSQKDKVLANKFARVLEGLDLHDYNADDPAVALRERFLRTGKQNKLSAIEASAFCVKAWNLWRTGQPLPKRHGKPYFWWVQSGPKSEAFPRII